MELLFDAVFQPGFFSSQPVHTAMIVGGGAAIVSGIVGVFAVIRGQSFAGHSLADISSAGGSGAFLLGANPLLGFVVMRVQEVDVVLHGGLLRAVLDDVPEGVAVARVGDHREGPAGCVHRRPPLGRRGLPGVLGAFAAGVAAAGQ